MTIREIAKYLKLHEITICKYATKGKIPGIRIGRAWRFDKGVIDEWISESLMKMKSQTAKKSKAKPTLEAEKRRLPKKKKAKRR